MLPRDAADYVKFHLETIECRYCAASIADLKAQQSAAEAEVAAAPAEILSVERRAPAKEVDSAIRPELSS